MVLTAIFAAIVWNGLEDQGILLRIGLLVVGGVVASLIAVLIIPKRKRGGRS